MPHLLSGLEPGVITQNEQLWVALSHTKYNLQQRQPQSPKDIFQNCIYANPLCVMATSGLLFTSQNAAHKEQKVQVSPKRYRKRYRKSAVAIADADIILPIAFIKLALCDYICWRRCVAI